MFVKYLLLLFIQKLLKNSIETNSPISGLGSLPGWPHLERTKAKNLLNLEKYQIRLDFTVIYCCPPLRELRWSLKGVANVFFLKICNRIGELGLSGHVNNSETKWLSLQTFWKLPTFIVHRCSIVHQCNHYHL